LRLIQKTSVVKPDLIDKILRESNEIAAILGKSLATAKGKSSQRKEGNESATS
jgi:hypothetical protein